MTTISETLDRIHEKAKELNIEINVDDEDITILALQRLLNDFEDVFVKVEEENSTIQILGWDVEYWWNDDDFDYQIEEDDSHYAHLEQSLKDGIREGELIFDDGENYFRGWWKKIK